MFFEVSKKQFKEVLKFLKQVKKIPNLRILVKEDTVYLEAFEWGTKISYCFKTEAQEDGEAVVYLKDFLKFLDSFKNSEKIRIEKKEDKIQVKSGILNIEISTIKMEVPEFETPESLLRFKINGKVLTETLEKVLPYMDLKNGLTVLKSINGIIKPIGENMFLEIVASDGYRLFLKQLPIEDVSIYQSKTRFRVEGRLIKILEKLFKVDDLIDIRVGDNRTFITYSNVSFTGWNNPDVYPDYDRVIPKQFKATIELKKSTLEPFITPFKGKDTRLIFKTTNGQLIVDLSTKEEESKLFMNLPLEAKVSGEDIFIAFQLQFILDTFKVLDSDDLIIKILDDLSPALFIPKNDNSEIHLLLPIRL